MAALVNLYIEQRRYLDAEPLAIIATNLLRDRLGGANPALAPVLADRARIALARGDKGEARKWAEEAVEIDRKNGTRQSSRLRVLGEVLAAQEQFEESEGVLRQALALARADGNQFEIARSLAALGDIDLKQKRFVEALPLIEEAALIDQTNLGPTHPLIAEDLSDLGLIYLATNRPGLAVKVFSPRLPCSNAEPDGTRLPSPIFSSISPAPSTFWAMAKNRGLVHSGSADSERSRRRRTRPPAERVKRLLRYSRQSRDGLFWGPIAS